MQLSDMIRKARQAIRLLLPFLAVLLSTAPAVADCDATISLVDFGRLDLQRGGDITGELVVQCDQPSEFSVTLSAGLGDYVRRRMRGPKVLNSSTICSSIRPGAVSGVMA